MSAWTDVVTHPLGLVGFSLFLLFTLLARRRRDSQWVMAVFLVLATVTLFAGLGFAYMKQQSPEAPSKPPAVAKKPPQRDQQQTVGDDGMQGKGARVSPSVRQETHGAQSPAVSNVQGPVTIINQGSESQPKRGQ